jgi:hypothetical protein
MFRIRIQNPDLYPVSQKRITKNENEIKMEAALIISTVNLKNILKHEKPYTSLNKE